MLKIGIPPAEGPSTAETVAAEKPPTPDDPRDSISRNLGGPYGAI